MPSVIIVGPNGQPIMLAHESTLQIVKTRIDTVNTKLDVANTNLGDIKNAIANQVFQTQIVIIQKNLTASGDVLIPGSGKSLMIYAVKFSLSVDLTQIDFKWGVMGAVFATFVTPKTGGLYGWNSHPNYIKGSVDTSLYCSITGTPPLKVGVNVEYKEV